MNNREKPIWKPILIFFSLWLSGLNSWSQEAKEGLCQKPRSDLNNETVLESQISDAIAEEASTVSLFYVAFQSLEENDKQNAMKQAMEAAFQYLIQLTAKQILSKEENKTPVSLEKKTRLNSRLFIRTYQTFPAEVCGDEYRFPMKVVLKIEDLKKMLLKSKVLDVEFAAKEIRLLNVKNAVDYRWVKEWLRKKIRNLKRLVEKYQRRGEVYFLVETSSPSDELILQLQHPRLKIQKNDRGGVHMTLLSK